MRKYLLGCIFLIAASPAWCQWNNNPAVNNIVANSNAREFADIAVTDGANGSIIFSNDYSGNGDIYVQKILSTGAIAWGATTNPVPVCVTTQEKIDAFAISDGSGGAFVTWTDYRSNADNAEIYIQKISSTGVVQWGEMGCGLQKMI